MNDLFMTFTSRLKVDAKCVYQQWNWITVANYFGTPPADWVHGYLYFEPGAWIWTKGFRRYLHIVKNWSGNFSLNSSRVRALGWPLLGIFSGFFWFFVGGSVGQIIYRDYMVFRGSNISCSLATAGLSPLSCESVSYDYDMLDKRNWNNGKHTPAARMHAHTHLRMHARMHARARARAHTHRHTHTHTHTHTPTSTRHTHTDTHTIHVQAHTHVHTNAHTLAHTHANTHMQTHVHAHMDIHTQTHTHKRRQTVIRTGRQTDRLSPQPSSHSSIGWFFLCPLPCVAEVFIINWSDSAVETGSTV